MQPGAVDKIRLVKKGCIVKESNDNIPKNKQGGHPLSRFKLKTKQV
jgi:hypothetical protein